MTNNSYLLDGISNINIPHTLFVDDESEKSIYDLNRNELITLLVWISGKTNMIDEFNSVQRNSGKFTTLNAIHSHNKKYIVNTVCMMASFISRLRWYMLYTDEINKLNSITPKTATAIKRIKELNKKSKYCKMNKEFIDVIMNNDLSLVQMKFVMFVMEYGFRSSNNGIISISRTSLNEKLKFSKKFFNLQEVMESLKTMGVISDFLISGAGKKQTISINTNKKGTETNKKGTETNKKGTETNKKGTETNKKGTVLPLQAFV